MIVYGNDSIELTAKVKNKILCLLNEYIPEPITLGLTDYQVRELAENIFKNVFGDLSSLAERDPAAKGSPYYVEETYTTFKCVMYYRLANIIYYSSYLDKVFKEIVANKISEAQDRYAIDIHPAAKIGKNFVVDHGVGTVIGETCQIGDNCYILNGVILGAEKIRGNSPGKRHPTLGNNVEIGAFARIIGPITIGDRVTIGANCLIRRNIPSDCSISVITELQVTRSQDTKLLQDKREIYGIIPMDNNIICIHGKGLENSRLSIICEKKVEKDIFDLKNIEEINVEHINHSDCIIQFRLNANCIIKENLIKNLKDIKICLIEGEHEIILPNSRGLLRALENIG